MPGIVRRNLFVGAVGLAVLLAAGPTPETPVADAAMKGDIEAMRGMLRDGADVNAAQGDGMTALHWAADRSDAEMVELLITAGALVEPVTRIGQYTPLHIASKGGDLAVVRALLDAGSDAMATTSTNGTTPLHLAAAAGNPEVVALLLDHGADPNARESEWGQTPLIFAAARDRADAIRVLLERGADPAVTANVVDLKAQGRLDRKARTRENAVLKAFRGKEGRASTPAEIQAAISVSREVYAAPPEEDEEEEKEDPNDFRALFAPPIDKTGGLTALLHAVREGYVEAALALLDGGASIDEVSAADGTSPLLMAAINGQFDIALVLLGRGADPDIASELNGVTPLWATVNAQWQPRTRFPQPQQRGLQRANYLDLMRALLEAGADPDARLTRHPWYMVYTGCGNRNCGLVDTNGSTAFWRAAYATDVEAMRLLVEFGADPMIPTKAPPRRQRLSTDEFLRRQALNRLSDSAYVDLDGAARKELMIAVRDELPDSMQVSFPDSSLDGAPDSVKLELIARSEKADSIRAEQPDPSGLPPVPAGGPAVFPVHAASGVGYGEGFAGNAHRHTPGGWMPAVRYLVEEVGADVNARDHNGYTPLHDAAARGDDEMARYLVEMGADVTAVSRRGQTTADMANGPVQRISPFPTTVALLESLGAVNNHNCLSC